MGESPLHEPPDIRLETDAEIMKTVQRTVLTGPLAYNDEQAGPSNQTPLTFSAHTSFVRPYGTIQRN